MPTARLIEMVANAVTAVAAVVAVSIAWSGLNTWRSQLRGKAEYELARRVLKIVYEVREAMTSVRRPMIWMTEILEAADALGDAAQKENWAALPEAEEAVYRLRWKRVQSAVSNLPTELLEAEVLWGPEAMNTLEPLRKRILELQQAVEAQVGYLSELRPGRKTEKNEYLKAQERVLKAKETASDDAFGQEVQQAVVIAERFLRPKLLVNT